MPNARSSLMGNVASQLGAKAQKPGSVHDQQAKVVPLEQQPSSELDDGPAAEFLEPSASAGASKPVARKARPAKAASSRGLLAGMQATASAVEPPAAEGTTERVSTARQAAAAPALPAQTAQIGGPGTMPDCATIEGELDIHAVHTATHATPRLRVTRARAALQAVSKSTAPATMQDTFKRGGPQPFPEPAALLSCDQEAPQPALAASQDATAEQPAHGHAPATAVASLADLSTSLGGPGAAAYPASSLHPAGPASRKGMGRGAQSGKATSASTASRVRAAAARPAVLAPPTRRKAVAAAAAPGQQYPEPAQPDPEAGPSTALQGGASIAHTAVASASAPKVAPQKAPAKRKRPSAKGSAGAGRGGGTKPSAMPAAAAADADSGSDYDPGDSDTGEHDSDSDDEQHCSEDEAQLGEEVAMEVEEGLDGLLSLKAAEEAEASRALDAPGALPGPGKRGRRKNPEGGRGKPAAKRAKRPAAKADDVDPANHPVGMRERDDDEAVWGAYGSDVEQLDPEAMVKSKVMDQMEAPACLLMPLLPYQKEFLAWAVKQEQSDIRGGILADEMGMGKTIQAISVIVTHRTDDMRSLPPIKPATLTPAAPSRQNSRPKLKLAGAPGRSAGETTRVTLEAGGSCALRESAASDTAADQVARQDGQAADAEQMARVGSHAADGVEGPELAQVLVEDVPCADPTDAEAEHVHDHAEAAATECCAGPSTSSADKFCKATLVVCPLVAVLQWRQEIARFTAPNTLKVVVYHGNKRAVEAGQLEQADVVLTTYSIIESEYRRETQPCKVPCSYCNKKFYPERLKVHLRFFCGPNAKKSAALAKQQKKRSSKQGGKAVTAMTAEDEGEASKDDEDDDGPKKAVKRPAKKAQRKSKAADPKGKGKQAARKGSKAKPAAKDKGKQVADTDSEWAGSKEEEEDSEGGGSDEEESGGGGQAARGGRWRRLRVPQGEWADQAEREAAAMIAEAERNLKRGADAPESLLHQICWRRIVLDEAHSIKDRRSSTARAVFALNSKYKWALSGTPLQNRVGELYSLVRFLRIFPYAYYFCTKKAGPGQCCACQSLDYSFRTNWRQCDHCKHSPLQHYCWWNKYVANPIKKFGYVGKGRAAMRVLKNEILERILLRRTKVQCADVLALPPRTVVMRKDRFDEREEDFYEALYTQSQAQFDAYVKTGTVVNNYAHIFDLLIRLRQAVDHPYLVVHSATAPGASAAAAPEEDKVEGICGVCHDPLEDPVAAACDHAFCRACITEYLEGATGQAKCPSCEKPLTVDLTATTAAVPVRVLGSKKSSILNRINTRDFQSSTKIEALREEIHLMRRRDPAAKCIVFSQFTSMLDLIFFRLQQVGLKCVRLEGSMSMEHRNRMIDAFTNDASVVVFLMSLKAGGVALNLTAASHVMLMDPWWNPAVEQQAQDRIHRLGQFKPIHVTRFVIGGTIEERILKLQEKKQLVFEGTVGRDAEALGRLTEDDLRFLFG